MLQLARRRRTDVIFDRTRWDLIRLVRGEDPADYARRQAARALNQLCEIYRAPVLAYLRRHLDEQDAEDVAQEFFSRRICPALLATAEAEKGRFRALLLVCLKNFLHDHNVYCQAQRRGGKVCFVSLQEAETTPSEEIADRTFDACWATTVIDRAMVRARRSFAARRDIPTYNALLPFISAPADRDEMEGVACRLGIGVKTLYVRLSRLRAAFAQAVREELANTVTRPEDIEPEIRYLLEVLSTAR